MTKSLQLFGIFAISALSGVGVSYQPSRGVSVDYLRVAEQERLDTLKRDHAALDQRDMEGPCAEGSLKATLTGLIVTCNAGKWARP